MSYRIGREQMLMEWARITSARSTCARRQVGAVIAVEGRPIATGYAGAPSHLPHCIDVGCEIGPDGGCMRTVHAEAAAIAFAARKGIATEGSTMYCTLSPCPACAKLILNAGISRVWYLEEYRILDGVEICRSGNIICEKLPMIYATQR